MTDAPTCHNCTTYDTLKCPDCAVREDDALCIEHPRLREYLMRDVVKELERLYNEETKQSSSYSEGKADGYDRAISLIKGVK